MNCNLAYFGLQAKAPMDAPAFSQARSVLARPRNTKMDRFSLIRSG
jgi:predicted transcriptional regulator